MSSVRFTPPPHSFPPITGDTAVGDIHRRNGTALAHARRKQRGHLPRLLPRWLHRSDEARRAGARHCPGLAPRPGSPPPCSVAQQTHTKAHEHATHTPAPRGQGPRAPRAMMRTAWAPPIGPRRRDSGLAGCERAAPWTHASARGAPGQPQRPAAASQCDSQSTPLDAAAATTRLAARSLPAGCTCERTSASEKQRLLHTPSAPLLEIHCYTYLHSAWWLGSVGRRGSVRGVANKGVSRPARPARCRRAALPGLGTGRAPGELRGPPLAPPRPRVFCVVPV